MRTKPLLSSKQSRKLTKKVDKAMEELNKASQQFVDCVKCKSGAPVEKELPKEGTYYSELFVAIV